MSAEGVTMNSSKGKCSPIFTLLVLCGLVWPGECRRNLFPVSLLQRAQICNTHFHPSTTPVPKSTCLLIFCTSTLFTDCDQNWSKHRNPTSAKKAFLCLSLQRRTFTFTCDLYPKKALASQTESYIFASFCITLPSHMYTFLMIVEIQKGIQITPAIHLYYSCC